MNKIMDDGGVEVSDHVLLSNPDSYSNFQDDLFVDELLKSTRTCTHTHTCNPPGPDAATHTHTCFHTHTQVISSGDDKEPSLKPRRTLGNREAVRKYREKKKAHTAHLEEEVKKLRLLNQQLVRRVQAQAGLEAEVSRLRTLLMDVRAKVDCELGFFPLQKPCNDQEGDCAARDLLCFNQQEGSSQQDGIGRVMSLWQSNCQDTAVKCYANEDEKANAENYNEQQLNVWRLALPASQGEEL